MKIIIMDDWNNTYKVGDKIQYDSPKYGIVTATIRSFAMNSKPRATIEFKPDDKSWPMVVAIYSFKNVVKLP